MKAKLCHCCYCWVAKSCPTLCDPMDCDPMDCDPNVSYYTTINNIASKDLFESSGQSDWIQGSGKNKVNIHLPSSTLWPHGPCKAPLFMGFPRQEYWSGLLFPSPGDLPDPGIEPASPAMAGGFFPTELPEKPLRQIKTQVNEFWFSLFLDVMQLTAS